MPTMRPLSAIAIQVSHRCCRRCLAGTSTARSSPSDRGCRTWARARRGTAPPMAAEMHLRRARRRIGREIGTFDQRGSRRDRPDRSAASDRHRSQAPASDDVPKPGGSSSRYRSPAPGRARRAAERVPLVWSNWRGKSARAGPSSDVPSIFHGIFTPITSATVGRMSMDCAGRSSTTGACWPGYLTNSGVQRISS